MKIYLNPRCCSYVLSYGLLQTTPRRSKLHIKVHDGNHMMVLHFRPSGHSSSRQAVYHSVHLCRDLFKHLPTVMFHISSRTTGLIKAFLQEWSLKCRNGKLQSTLQLFQHPSLSSTAELIKALRSKSQNKERPEVRSLLQ